MSAPALTESPRAGATACSTEPTVAPSLREALLGGAHTRRDFDFSAFEDFLRDDSQALALWFGDALPPVSTLRNMDRGQIKELLRGRIDRDVATIDAALRRQTDAILHHPAFQRLEGSWRGLLWLVSSIEPHARVIARVFSARRREISRDLERALEFDQSSLFKLIYESEFGHPGGQPYGLIVFDYELAHRAGPRGLAGDAPTDDVMMLKRLAAIAAAAFVPVVAAASPRLFDVDQFSELTLAREITVVVSNEEHRRWNSVTQSEDSRFICVTLPRILARAPWTRATTRGQHVEYAPTERERSWFSAGYALARNVVRAQTEFRWPADIRGVTPGANSGGVVLDAPRDPFVFGAATQLSRASTELSFTDQQERALALSGFMALNTLPYGEVAFASVSSLQYTPPGSDLPTPAAANRRLSAETNALLCVCRFAHHIKMLGRDMVGRHTSPAEIERELQKWLNHYCNMSTLASRESRARFPLLASAVQVSEATSRPGEYHCVIHLQPHYQLDDVSTTFRLVTSLAPDGGTPGGVALTTKKDKPA
ncbi:type VI secretion system contractile sheath large subunit [Acetobacter sp. DsW_063]|uniref:type VI secretion system contractile sheath large subunit n=1 Tax=Acetobacter sp. DsW_063 TaxID=1514894 RepID=UPI000A3B1BCD|nr:type VI secretion system contractile sheath large subunit [Acetobacter sp. DsW_063]